MNDRHAYFATTANALYRRGVKSHIIAELSRFVGESMSTRTILRNARSAGFANPNKMKVGIWSKPHFARWGWRKKRTLSVLLQKIGLAFSAWVNFVRSGGEFDLEAILAGEKPP